MRRLHTRHRVMSHLVFTSSCLCHICACYARTGEGRLDQKQSALLVRTWAMPKAAREHIPILR